MNHTHCGNELSLNFENTTGHCPIGESTAKNMIAHCKIPVISCEGFCIRGDIARTAANMLARVDGYGRACHGEILAVPHSAMAEWARNAEKVVVIDGCFLHCHGRMIRSVLKENQLVVIDALSFYGKYTDIMDPDDVPENERKETARLVFENTLRVLESGPQSVASAASCGCCKQ
jgi:uncharacterized metal-binding protein